MKKEKNIPPAAGPRRFLREVALFLLDILYNAVIIIVLVVLIRTFLISPFRVIGSSMADTLASNEFILIDRLSYRLGEPHRGDPIVFRPPITNKYPSKFEKVVSEPRLDFSALRTTKTAIYCQNPWLAKWWFCRDTVHAGDRVFVMPVPNAALEPDELSWKKATEEPAVTGEQVKSEVLTFPIPQGSPSAFYRVRIYDAGGPEYFVKRIVGIPGDTIKIENGRVYLKPTGGDSFHVVQEPFLNTENLNHTYFSQETQNNTFTVPEGQYFVLGDNRNHSNDSRSWLSPVTEERTPFVQLSEISGKVLVVLWPPQAIRLILGADLQ